MEPLLLYATVLLASFGESTAFVGLVVPGVGIVLGAGLLATRGLAEPGWVGALASLGASAGFAFSYWLGRVGGPRISRWSARAEGAVARSRSFFHRYGAWGVFWGHFFGPLRALVAFAAGASGLPPRRFWPASLAGALAWGYGLTLIGVAGSGGWALVEARLGRASLLLAALTILVYLVLRLATGALLLGLRLLPSATRTGLWFLERGAASARLDRLFGTHPALGAWLRRRISPDRATGLLLTTGILVCAAFAWLFFGVVEDLLFKDPLVRVDGNVFHLLQALRSPGGDRLFLAVTEAGGTPTVVAALGAAVLGLLWLKRSFEAGLLLGGLALGEVLMWGLKQAVGRPRPVPLAPLALENTGAFPSNHAFSTLALYGFLAYLAGRRVVPRRRARLYAVVGLGVVAVGASLLYLGAHWLSDLVAGYALAGLWLATLITAAETHRRFGPPSSPAPRARLRIVGAVVVLAALAAWSASAASSLRRLPPAAQWTAAPPVPTARSPQDLDRLLPELLRPPAESLLGRELFRPGLALVGPAEDLLRETQRAGWVPVRPLDGAALLSQARMAVGGRFDLAAPVAPAFQAGRPPDLALARAAGQGREILRLWRVGEAPPWGPLWVTGLQVQGPPRRFLGLALPGRPAAAPADWAARLAAGLTAAGGFSEESSTAEGGKLLLPTGARR